jgi:hypothetical protein
MRRIAYIALALLLALPASAGAQAPSTPLHDALRREAARLARNASVTPATSAALHATASAAPQRSWPARHPILLGTLAGTGIGLGVLATHDCRKSSDYSCSALAAFFGGTGAGLGALGGAVASIFLP